MTKAQLFREAINTDHDDCTREDCFLDVLKDIPKTMRRELSDTVKIALTTLTDETAKSDSDISVKMANMFNCAQLAEFYAETTMFKQFCAAIWSAGCHTGYRYRLLVERDERSASELEKVVGATAQTDQL